jgi:hypothetical protein
MTSQEGGGVPRHLLLRMQQPVPGGDDPPVNLSARRLQCVDQAQARDPARALVEVAGGAARRAPPSARIASVLPPR